MRPIQEPPRQPQATPPRPPQGPSNPPPKRTLAAVVGGAAAAILVAIVPQFEGSRNVGYLDPVGIATKCMGDTTNVVVGQRYTDAECIASLNDQLVAHAEPVIKCTPVLLGKPNQLAAAVSFAYNVGVNNYCGSTIARRFNDRDFRGACRQFNESDAGKPQWVTARGVVLPGLVKRRLAERTLCEKGL